MKSIKFFSLIMVLLFSCNALSSVNKATLDSVKHSGKLVIAVQKFGPPVNFEDKHGKRTGLSYQIAKEFAKAMNVELVVKAYDWPDMISALENKEVDMIASDMTPTVGRSLSIAFSNPVFFENILALKNTQSTLPTLEAANNGEHTIVVVKNTTHEVIAKTMFNKANIVTVSTGPDVAKYISTGKADIGIYTEQAIRPAKKDYKNITFIGDELGRDPTSFAFHLKSDSLRNVFNNFLMLSTYNGSLKKMKDYWWNSDEWLKEHLYVYQN